MRDYCFGIDIGGTTIKIGLFTKEGNLLDKWEVTTRKENSGSFILGDIANSVLEKLEEKQIKKEEMIGAGIGIPGPVTDDGIVLTCVNLGWGMVALAEQFKELTDFDCVKVNNDANVAALGEMWKGGGEGYSNVVMVTLGTGVGGGIIVNGEIISGSKGAAGEIGHITVENREEDCCNCGKRGCLEQFASATGIVKQTKRLLEQTEEASILRERKELSAKVIFDACKEGDQLANEAVEQLGSYLGMALSHVAAVVDPEVFVIGGGVSKAGNILLEVIKKNYEANVFSALKGREFKLAKLENDAGIYGCAKLVLGK